MTNQDYLEALLAVENFDKLLHFHPSHDMWKPHLNVLVENVETAYQQNDSESFNAVICELGDYITQVQRELEIPL